ncbi:MAG: bifunctional D-glycero-beta-D-manno-heptose-7-phosphate kinase/D-glycero-beta-D-manno-heptose 1-phosphate adenylyltransferase HldE [Chitinivibrionales bacterium]|nr:bifunctional D-glycero-beta-D-manno-heptose-7-phosphate kinase/D-glycero-beta-D-manno-heptose 1-phosphate adenylyltransferase HldE [Chitinivibrionales bacterium]
MQGLDFSKVSVLVVGDVMLDRYYIGSAQRISPEAPVPVIRVQKETQNLGGAGNVANNIAHLGARAWLCGFVGEDIYGHELGRIVEEAGIVNCLVKTKARTIAKTRVVGEHQQIVRVDIEDDEGSFDLPVKAVERMILKAMKQVSAVVISDYKKGMCSQEICSFVIKQAAATTIPVIVDPKGTAWEKYRRATIVTPNFKEFQEVVGKDVTNCDDDIKKFGGVIRKKFELDNLLVTRSEKGMSLVGEKSFISISTEAKEVYDVSGAGDTVVATCAVALGGGYSLEEAVRLSNKAAGVVVSKLGTVPVEIQELRDVVHPVTNQKLVTLESIRKICLQAAGKGQKIVFTNGCFDILHKGHVRILRQAKEMGDILIVGLNSDSSVRKLKGPSRPINDELDRAELLGSLECVDYVVIFKEETPKRLISQIRPDVLVKGGDYKVEDIVGREYAGKTVVIPFVEGYSTTGTLQKLKS